MRLDGICVLDLTRLLPGPYATQLLADMGAEIIKIEDPEVGDYARFTEPMAPNGLGALFSSVNNGKKSVTINLKSDRGRDVFYRLVEEADVVFEQFRPGVAERLDVGYETVREYNSEIVYCSLSGYGQDGPYRDRVGHDLNYVGIAGLVDMTRQEADGPPTIPGYPIGDMAGGVFSALSILGALLSRELGTADGNYIDVSMMEAVVSFSQAVTPVALYGGTPRPGQTTLTGQLPCYDIYQTKDGRYITIAALEPKFWERLCTELDVEHLIDHHLAGDEATRRAVREELAEIFQSKTREEWEKRLGGKEVMFGPVKRMAEVVEDPQIQSRNIIKTTDGEPPRVGYPAKVTDGLDGGTESVPSMGEHTAEVLEDVGFDADDIDALKDANAI